MSERDLQGIGIYQGHDDTMSSLIHRDRDREPMFVQDLQVQDQLIMPYIAVLRRTKTHLHECKLLLGGQSRHVHPTRRLALAQVISLLLDRSETDST